MTDRTINDVAVIHYCEHPREAKGRKVTLVPAPITGTIYRGRCPDCGAILEHNSESDATRRL
jgi:hypothetical protein